MPHQSAAFPCRTWGVTTLSIGETPTSSRSIPTSCPGTQRRGCSGGWTRISPPRRSTGKSRLSIIPPTRLAPIWRSTLRSGRAASQPHRGAARRATGSRGDEHGYERSFPLLGGQKADASLPSTTYLITGGGGAFLENVGSLPQCVLSGQHSQLSSGGCRRHGSYVQCDRTGGRGHRPHHAQSPTGGGSGRNRERPDSLR